MQPVFTLIRIGRIPTRGLPEQGIAIVLFLLLLIPLVGLTALVLDIGYFSLARQRMLLATDMAALSSADLLHQGADVVPVDSYARNVVAATITANGGFSRTRWDSLTRGTRVTIDAVSDAARVRVEQNVHPVSFFGNIYSQQAQTASVYSAAAYDLREPHSARSLHLMLLVDLSDTMLSDALNVGDVVGSAEHYCLHGGPETQQPRRCDRQGFLTGCQPACVTRKDVVIHQINAIVELLGSDDKVTIVGYGDFAEPLVVAKAFADDEKVAFAEGLDDTLTEFRDTVVGDDFNTHSPAFVNDLIHDKFRNNPARALDIARRLLNEGVIDTDITTLALLTRGAVSWGALNPFATGTEFGESAYGDYEQDESRTVQSDWKSGLEAEYGPALELLRRGEGCSTGYRECLSYFENCWATFDASQCEQLRAGCLKNPVKFYEHVAGIIASTIQTEHFARIFTIGIGENVDDLSESGFAYAGGDLSEHPWGDPRRERNFLLELANDRSKPRVGTSLRLDCSPRPPKQQGRHFSPAPSGPELLNTAKELLRLARRGADDDIAEGTFAPRLVSPVDHEAP